MEGQSVSGSEQHQSELQSLCVLFTPVTHVVAIRGWEPHSHASNNTRCYPAMSTTKVTVLREYVLTICSFPKSIRLVVWLFAEKISMKSNGKGEYIVVECC